MRDVLERLEREFAEQLAGAASDLSAIDAVRVRYLGRKGELTGLMKQLGTLSREEKPLAGKAINELKQRVVREVEAANEQARGALRAKKLASERSDTTLPPRAPWPGSVHPVTSTRRDLEEIFSEMGFTVESGP